MGGVRRQLHPPSEQHGHAALADVPGTSRATAVSRGRWIPRAAARGTSRPGSCGIGAFAGRYQRRRDRREGEVRSSGTASARGRQNQTRTGASERTLAAQLEHPIAAAHGRHGAHDDPSPGCGVGLASARRLQLDHAFMWAPRGAGVASKPQWKTGPAPGLSRSAGPLGAGAASAEASPRLAPSSERVDVPSLSVPLRAPERGCGGARRGSSSATAGSAW